ncbi:MraY family glycosyltransferase [Paraburkholderia bannensis]|uniref:MraY family glycosyltransferase n=1 Tax=Paraburkholderia bannensis TaxID=765414 RepID=UPI002AC3320D|nr:glycosyltransferase family 4 protein [Paraburkholderia bannensis]
MSEVSGVFSASEWATLATAALSALASFLILRLLLASGLAWRIATDVPNHRSLHVKPIPRVGGWGIVPVSLVALLLHTSQMWLIAVAAAALALVSQIDDRRDLSARVRFAVHLAAVVALVVLWPAAAPWWLLAGVGFLMLWMVNLYNFMDGADGLAGGMALAGFGAYAVGALIGTHPVPALAISCAAVAGAALGFLLLNFHPAKLFLGDAGSITLGFLAGALGYWGWRGEVWPLWFPAMVFSPFIADASVTLLRRLSRGEKFWQAHREHYYQRMVRSGIGHARTAVYWYAVMLVGGALALWALGLPTSQQWIIFSAWYAVLGGCGAIVDLRWRRFGELGEK